MLKVRGATQKLPRGPDVGLRCRKRGATRSSSEAHLFYYACYVRAAHTSRPLTGTGCRTVPSLTHVPADRAACAAATAAFGTRTSSSDARRSSPNALHVSQHVKVLLEHHGERDGDDHSPQALTLFGQQQQQQLARQRASNIHINRYVACGHFCSTRIQEIVMPRMTAPSEANAAGGDHLVARRSASLRPSSTFT